MFLDRLSTRRKPSYSGRPQTDRVEFRQTCRLYQGVHCGPECPSAGWTVSTDRISHLFLFPFPASRKGFHGTRTLLDIPALFQHCSEHSGMIQHYTGMVWDNAHAHCPTIIHNHPGPSQPSRTIPHCGWGLECPRIFYLPIVHNHPGPSQPSITIPHYDWALECPKIFCLHNATHLGLSQQVCPN